MQQDLLSIVRYIVVTMMVIEAVWTYSHYSTDIAAHFFTNIDNDVKIRMKDDDYTRVMGVHYIVAPQ